MFRRNGGQRYSHKSNLQTLSYNFAGMWNALQRGMGKDQMESIVEQLCATPAMVPDLIELLKEMPAANAMERKRLKVRCQKAAWVIRRLSEVSPEQLLPHHARLHGLLDDIDDSSVLRELMKALDAPAIRLLESQVQIDDLSLIGCSWMEDPAVPRALHYLGMQLVENRMGKSKAVSSSDALQSLDRMVQQAHAAGGNSGPLIQCAIRRRHKWLLKISHERNPQSAGESPR